MSQTLCEAFIVPNLEKCTIIALGFPFILFQLIILPT